MEITKNNYKSIMNAMDGLKVENGDAAKLYTTEFEKAHKGRSHMYFSEQGWLNAFVDKDETLYFEFNTTEYAGSLEVVPYQGKYNVFVNENYTELNEAVISQLEWLINTFGNDGWKLMDREISGPELVDADKPEKTERVPVEPTIKPMIQTLENLFGVFNKRFFNGELETPVITIAPDTCRAYGWFTTWRAWKETDNKDGEGYYEITVTADYLDRDPVDIAATLLHEMIHLYNRMHDINDCSRGGKYHNKKFKTAAESHGLICEKNSTYGFSQTEATEETAEFIKTLDLRFDLYRPQTSEKPTPDDDKDNDKDDKSGENEKPKKKRSSTRKYVCPKCGTIIRATKEVNVICGECGVPFELVD